VRSDFILDPVKISSGTLFREAVCFVFIPLNFGRRAICDTILGMAFMNSSERVRKEGYYWQQKIIMPVL
jgi:hypothetical protein